MMNELFAELVRQKDGTSLKTSCTIFARWVCTVRTDAAGMRIFVPACVVLPWATLSSSTALKTII